MKFTDGNWMMQPGVRAHYPAQAYEIETTPSSLTIHAPTKRINHRGDTLDGPLLTVRFSSPLPDIIRVQISHFAGKDARKPKFPIVPPLESPVQTDTSDAYAALNSGNLSVRIARESAWNVEFVAQDRVVTRSGSRSMGYAAVDGVGRFVHEQLALGVGECVYGLGERFTAFVKNGQVVETWNKDGGTGSEQAYKNVPFYLTNGGYGVFVNHPENVSFEVASEKVSRVQFCVEGEHLEYFLIYGPTPGDVLRKYAALTGRPALPPAWSFGLWLTTSFTTSYDEETVTQFLEGMSERHLPLHVFHFDCFWMREFHWCDFVWDERTFPDPTAMLQRLKSRGLRICVWINPYIAQLSSLFAEAHQNGYLIKKPNGEVWQTDQWQAGMGIVDFTNPAACNWYADKLAALLDMGVDCFKTDFGERIPTDVVYFDGSDAGAMHNFYAYLYNKTVFNVLKEKRCEGEAVLFARSATAGCQQFPVHWGGDCYSSFESMAESLRGGLSLGLSGFGFWSHDIGGFEGTPPTEVYKRWIAFGLLSSHSRLHGSSSYRVPWVFDEEAVEVLNFFTRLKCRLMPYLYAQAVEASQSGLPMLRAMLLEFPGDPACLHLDRQYMLGGAILVAPVFSADGDVDYYVPTGTWTNYLTGAPVTGPGWFRETHNFLSLPLLVRPHSIVAEGSHDTIPDYSFNEAVTLVIYALRDRQDLTVTVPGLNGETALSVTARREETTIYLNWYGDAPGIRFVLAGVHSVRCDTAGHTESLHRGVQITPSATETTLTISLS